MFLFQQTKRKLDDAAKRLGHLYDKLREQSVRIRSDHDSEIIFKKLTEKLYFKKLLLNDTVQLEMHCVLKQNLR